MNQTSYPDNGSDASWPAPEHRMPVPDTSMLPGSEKAPPAMVGLLKTAVRGAHQTIDRVADRAEPAVRQLGDNVAAAEQTLQAKTHQLRQTRDVWLGSVRGSVRDSPLASVAGAFLLGALVARITR